MQSSSKKHEAFHEKFGSNLFMNAYNCEIFFYSLTGALCVKTIARKICKKLENIN